jgi:putative signal transducing protein
MTDVPNDDPYAPTTVLETSDLFILATAKSRLEEAGIEYFAAGEGVQDIIGAGRIGAGFNPVTGPVRLQVAAEEADQAAALLGDLVEAG